jgi:hypothetical protein
VVVYQRIGQFGELANSTLQISQVVFWFSNSQLSELSGTLVLQSLVNLTVFRPVLLGQLGHKLTVAYIEHSIWVLVASKFSRRGAGVPSHDLFANACSRSVRLNFNLAYAKMRGNATFSWRLVSALLLLFLRPYLLAYS